VYDLGETTAALAHRFSGLDVLLLEANHDTTMLWAGWYPAAVKRRIAGRMGHLSNDQAAHFAAEVAHRGLQRVVLCHLSQNNNTPRRAWVAVNDALKRTAFRGSVGLAQQDGIAVVQVGSRSTAKQLELSI
jgi:phosphoribosyl 1,2-cyclic phosphodiesterase